MGIFHDMIEAVNRTSKSLNVRFDGQDMNLPPNYDTEGHRLKGVHTMVPRTCVPYALNQNVLMGSEDGANPSAFTSMIGFIDGKDKKTKSWHDISFIPDEEIGKELTRVPLREYLEDDPQVKDVVVRGHKLDPSVKIPSGGTFDVRGGMA